MSLYLSGGLSNLWHQSVMLPYHHNLLASPLVSVLREAHLVPKRDSNPHLPCGSTITADQRVWELKQSWMPIKHQTKCFQGVCQPPKGGLPAHLQPVSKTAECTDDDVKNILLGPSGQEWAHQCSKWQRARSLVRYHLDVLQLIHHANNKKDCVVIHLLHHIVLLGVVLWESCLLTSLVVLTPSRLFHWDICPVLQHTIHVVTTQLHATLRK